MQIETSISNSFVGFNLEKYFLNGMELIRYENLQ